MWVHAQPGIEVKGATGGQGTSGRPGGPGGAANQRGGHMQQQLSSRPAGGPNEADWLAQAVGAANQPIRATAGLLWGVHFGHYTTSSKVAGTRVPTWQPW